MYVPLLTHTVQPTHHLRKPSSIVNVLIGMILMSCIGLAVFDSGAVYCSAIDHSYHLTTCYQTIKLDGIVRNITFSADSRLLAVLTHSHDHVVRIWDVHTGSLVHEIATPQIERPYQNAFSPDSLYLATAGMKGVQVVNLTTLQIVYTIPGLDPREHGGIAFSSDGHILAWSSAASIHLYDATDGTLFQTIQVFDGLDTPMIRFTPDSRHILFWVGGETRLWDIQSQQIVWRLPESAEASANAATLILPTTIMYLAESNDQYLIQQEIHGGCRYRDRAIFPSNDRMLSIDNTYDDLFWPSPQATMCVWRISDGSIVWQSQAQGYCVEIAPDGNVAAVCDNGIQLWKIPGAWYQ